MTFELVQKIVATIIRTVENSAVMSVRALKAHTFSVRVSNQPSTQSIKGTVTVGNQKNIEKLLAKLSVAVAKLPTVYPETKIPSPLPYPKEISVSNLESVPQADLKRVEELLMKLVREMKTLPKEYPKQEKFPTIPAFPKFPEFPKQLPFPTSMKVNVPAEIRVNNIKDMFEDLMGKDPKKYLNVRLTDGKEFYKAMQEIVTSGGSRLPFIDSQGSPTGLRLTAQGYLPVVFAETPPTDTSKLNPLTVLSYNAAGDVVKVVKTISGINYQKTLSNTDTIVVTTKTISAWS